MTQATERSAFVDTLSPVYAHIYALTSPNRELKVPPTLEEFNDQGYLLHQTTGAFTGLTDPFYMTYDPHNGWIYVFNQIDSLAAGRLVTAYDRSGNRQTLPGGFPNAGVASGIVYDPRNHFIYLSNWGAPSGANLLPPTITAYDEAGNQLTLAGTFPNLGTIGDISYDPHNGWIYYDGATIVGTNVTSRFTEAFDDQGHPIKLTGNFANTDVEALTYDSHNGLLYGTLNAHPGQPFFPTMAAFDEQGNEQALSPGFPPGMSVDSGVYDESDGLLYANVQNFSPFTDTIVPFDEDGREQIVPGHFDSPRATITGFVLLP